jgi:TonB family protein
MNELIAYLIKVSIGTLLLYLCFHLFFRQDTFYFRNRIILILTILLPLLLPFIQIKGYAGSPASVTIIHSVITVSAAFEGQVNTLDYNGLIITIWLGIACLLLLRTIIGLMETASVIRKGDLDDKRFPKLIISDLDHPPFSFWPFAVIPRKIFDNGEAEDIITHEYAHIRQGHTFDLIICELYTSFFWFNPAAWLIKRSVRLNHEFLADQEFTRCSADIKNYQYKLLNIPVEFNRIQFAHSFNNLIKNRIVMINKQQTNAYAALKILLIVPVVALIFAAFSCNNNATSTKDIANDQTAPKKLTEIKIENPAESQNGEEVFARVEQMPVFPGGEKAMMKFIHDNLKYPVSAQERGVQGIVIINFVIGKDGKISRIKVMRPVGSGCDEEAIRVLEKMPAWTPGKQGGRDVAVSYMVPFKFVLN